MKGRNEGRKNGRTELIEWKNKGRNNREWKEGETESRRTRKKIERMEERKKE
jgi:hypothetical protein